MSEELRKNSQRDRETTTWISFPIFQANRRLGVDWRHEGLHTTIDTDKVDSGEDNLRHSRQEIELHNLVTNAQMQLVLQAQTQGW